MLYQNNIFVSLHIIICLWNIVYMYYYMSMCMGQTCLLDFTKEHICCVHNLKAKAWSSMHLCHSDMWRTSNPIPLEIL